MPRCYGACISEIRHRETAQHAITLDLRRGLCRPSNRTLRLFLRHLARTHGSNRKTLIHFQPTGDNMTTIEQKQAIVEKGVKAQAVVDKNLAIALRGANNYAKAIEDAVKNGFFTSPLEAKRMLAQARSLPGKIAEAAELAAILHISGTQLAIDNEADLGSVSSVGGVDFVRRDDGGFTIQSGGGR